jgi:membrane protease YdiL (CAAX protease family)
MGKNPSPDGGLPRRYNFTGVRHFSREISSVSTTLQDQELPDRQSWNVPEPALSRKGQALEVSVFLLLIVPSMVISLFAIRAGTLNFTLTAFAVSMRDVGLLVLILFFLWRNGEPWEKIGWTRKNLGQEIVLGVVLYVPFFWCIIGVDWLVRQLGLTAPSTQLPSFLTANDIPQIVLALLLVAVVAVTEETIFRGYLLLRLGASLRSMFWAVILSSVIFSIGHGYEGTAGVATVGVMGVVFALIYLWRGSLAAPMVIHFLQDFSSIVLLGLLQLK